MRPVVGIMCGNEDAARPIQAVASRFIEPVTRLCGATVMLVPAVRDAVDPVTIAGLLDGLLLTGGRSHVSSRLYGGDGGSDDAVDAEPDAVALSLAEQMLKRGKPVFGICRGLQEINVLFGGSLRRLDDDARHHPGDWDADYAGLFTHRHVVDLMPNGALATASRCGRIDVNSVYQMGIDRLGAGLAVEAVAADDGLIEAIAAPACGSDVLAVQWHPEWDAARCSGNRAFFTLFGAALGRASAIVQ